MIRVLAGIAALLASPGNPGRSEPDSAAENVEFTERQRELILQLSPLGPPPPDPTNRYADDLDAAHLGQYLFFDRRLSADGTLSCASCHDPAKGFADGKPVAEGLGVGRRNTPTIWNVAYQRWFAWDGRFDSLWSQALDPIEGPAELGGSRLQTARVLHDDPQLKVAYEGLFGPLPALSAVGRFPRRGRPDLANPSDADHAAWQSLTDEDRYAVNIVFANVGKAMAAYQRRVLSRRAPFDVFVEGLHTGDANKLRALSPSAQRGLKLFVGAGNCRLCHGGPALTDGEFHNILVPPRGGGPLRDPGRYGAPRLLRSSLFNAGGPFSDDRVGAAAQLVEFLADTPETWGRFKTPALRNVALTAPYMRQGQFETLGDVVRFYATLEGAARVDHHQEQILVPLNLSERQQLDLVAFLESLTDVSIDPALLRQPESPHRMAP